MADEKPPQVNLPIACACQAEGMAELNALVGGRTATSMLHELYWEHSYTIEWIGVDMWMGAMLRHPSASRPDIRVEFDLFEHGLATAIKYLQEQTDG